MSELCTSSDMTIANEDRVNTSTRKYNKRIVWTIASDGNKQESAHFYDDAIDLAGNGRYNIGLLLTLILMTLSTAMDMFGFSVVVASSVCDLKLHHNQTSFLMSMPFIGPIFMSYVWGYLSDTRGRKKSLMIATSVSFISATASAFSPNWITLGVFRFLSTSFSCCAQSVTYALLSESCPPRVKTAYVIIMTSMLIVAPVFCYGIGYFIVNLKFSLDMGYLTFTPWRLLVLILASPLGISSLAMAFFYESPKFLLNAGYEPEALELLKRIYYRNGGEKGTYPVIKLILNEEDSVRDKNVPFLKSLWLQTAPLFQPPLLIRTLQLYFLTAIVYSTNNSFFMWYPFLVKAFFEGSISSSAEQLGLCSTIAESQHIKTNSAVTCDSSLDMLTCVSCIVPAVLQCVVNLIIVKLSSRRKALILVILTTTLVCCIGSMLVKNNLASFLLFIGVFFCVLCISIVFSYYIDLFPTSHRGMVTCLSIMVARSSTLAGTNLVGAFLMGSCSITFYAWSVFILSGVIVACFLPPDRPKKST